MFLYNFRRAVSTRLVAGKSLSVFTVLINTLCDHNNFELSFRRNLVVLHSHHGAFFLIFEIHKRNNLYTGKSCHRLKKLLVMFIAKLNPNWVYPNQSYFSDLLYCWKHTLVERTQWKLWKTQKKPYKILILLQT